MDITVRPTEVGDYPRTEYITREAFWNLYVPGCEEHYLLHAMREHPDFVRELDYVLLADGEIIGSIAYTKSAAVSEAGERVATLTFGPVSVLPGYQRRGYGAKLIDATLGIARSMDISAVIIFGLPRNYVGRGFVSAKRHGIGVEGNRYPAGLLAYVTRPQAFENRSWVFRESGAYEVDHDRAAAFDAALPKKEKGVMPSQEEFWIASNSFLA